MSNTNRISTMRFRTLCLALATCFATPEALANPTSPVVTNGAANFISTGSTLTVTNTPNAIINWQSFSINTGETTRFIQQSAASAVLNRVTGGDPSVILGALQSNGRVFLINPSGIVFGAGAQIDTAGLVASTLNMTDADFIRGRMRFDANVTAPGNVTNAGNIRTPNGGFVYLIAPQVENSGVISTPSGEAILAAGHAVEIVDSVDPNQRVLVSAQSGDVNLSQLMQQNNGNIFSVLNSGKVSANTVTRDATGRIYFKSAGNLQTTATSVIEAKGDVALNGGRFQGYANVAALYQGSFDISGQNGGFIETSGHWINVDDAHILAHALDPAGKGGTWLLDPWDITIAAAGAQNYFQSGGTFTPTTSPSVVTAGLIETQLNSGTSVVIDTTYVGGTEQGNILVNTNITKNAGTDATLTLKADNDIILAANVVIKSNLSKLNVVLNADQDSSGAGRILLNNGSQIQSNGGNIILGGGASPSSGYAVGTASAGVTLTGAQLASAGGNIIINGRGSSGNAGVSIGTSVIDSATGTISIDGQGGSAAAANQRGVVISGTSVLSSDGNIVITGTGNGSGGSSDGMLLNANTLIRSSGAGSITLNGTGASVGGNNAGVAIADGGTLVRTNTGMIAIAGTGLSASGGSFGLIMWNGSQLRSDLGSIYIAADSAVAQSMQMDSGTTIRADNGSVYISTTGGAIVLNDGLLKAGSSVLLNSATDIVQGSTHALETNQLIANSGGLINLSGLSNNITGTVAAIGTDTTINNLGNLFVVGLLTPTTGVSLTSSNGGVSFITPGALNINVPWTFNSSASASSMLYVGTDLIMSNTLTLNGGINTSVFTGGSLILNGGTINYTPANGFLTFNIGCDLTLLASASNAEIKATGANTELALNVLGDVTLTSGISGLARIYTAGHLDMVVSGLIDINSGGLPATIAAASGNTIDIDMLSVSSGGYFVNGKEGTVYDSATGSGFLVGGTAAILNTNLFFTYGGLSSAIATQLGLFSEELLGSSELDELYLEGLDAEDLFGKEDGDDRKNNKPRECRA